MNVVLFMGLGIPIQGLHVHAFNHKKTLHLIKEKDYKRVNSQDKTVQTIENRARTNSW